MITLIISIIVLLYFSLNGIESFFHPAPLLCSVQVKTPINAMPKVSIIIPARNEEKNIAAALLSLLALDYANKEIILVNDRSEDCTGEIAAQICHQYPSLKVIHNQSLPEGWLGKNHALQLGAAAATGEWLLFADADIVFTPDALAKAVAYASEHQLDHLTVSPKMQSANFLFAIIMTVLATIYALNLKPWRAKNPRCKNSVGIGAFNLVKASVYAAIGGHQQIRMNVDDDIKLGQVIKQQHYRQELLDGRGCLEVEWYSSVREMIHGMEKNAFAYMNYNPAVVIFYIAMTLLLYFLPLFLLFSHYPVVALINFVTIVVTMALHVMTGKYRLGYHQMVGFFYPVGIAIYLYIILRSMIKVLRDDSLKWRGTSYALAFVKSQHLKTKW